LEEQWTKIISTSNWEIWQVCWICCGCIKMNNHQEEVRRGYMKIKMELSTSQWRSTISNFNNCIEWLDVKNDEIESLYHLLLLIVLKSKYFLMVSTNYWLKLTFERRASINKSSIDAIHFLSLWNRWLMRKLLKTGN